MKKTTILFVLLIAVFASCADESVQKLAVDVDESIVGTWATESREYSNCADPDNHPSETYSCSVYCIKYNFTSDGDYLLQEVEDGNRVVDEVSGEYSISGENLAIGNWGFYKVSIDGSVMTWTGEEDGCNVIVVLNKL